MLNSKKKKIQYLLSFSEYPVFKTPGDGGCGIARRLTGQGDLFVKLRGSLVIQVGNFGLHWKEDHKKKSTENQTQLSEQRFIDQNTANILTQDAWFVICVSVCAAVPST